MQSQSIPETLETPLGTIDHPIERKCRLLTKKQRTLITGIPKEIVNLMDIEKLDSFDVYCDLQEQKIALQKK